MEQGYVLLALIAIPLFTAAALVFVPARTQGPRARSSPSRPASCCSRISLYVFIAYQAGDDEQFHFQLR